MRILLATMAYGNDREAIGNNPSLIWKSILAAKDLLVKGIGWRLENASDIQVYNDPWLPDDAKFFMELIIVSELFSRGWPDLG